MLTLIAGMVANFDTYKWFCEFLQGRKFYVCHEGQSSDTYDLPNNGVCQGSCPGPQLWNIVADTCTPYILKFGNNCHVVAYADDLTVSLTGDSWHTIEAKLNIFTTAMCEWLNACNVAVNPVKSYFMRFGKSKDESQNENFTITVQDNVLSEVEEFRFLGIRHNNELSIAPQIEHIIQKFKSIFVIAKSLYDFGSKAQIKNILLSYSIGVFNHGMCVVPPLSVQQSNAIQTPLNKSLRIVYNCDTLVDGKFISQAKLLTMAKVRTVIHNQLYLAISYLDKVIRYKSPKSEYDIIKSSMFYEGTHKNYFDPFEVSQTGRIIKLSDLSVFKDKFKFDYQLSRSLGKRNIVFRIPKKYGNIKSVKKKFPFCYFSYMNKLPYHIRCNFGFKSNTYMLKAHYNAKCPHKVYSANQKHCKECSHLHITEDSTSNEYFSSKSFWNRAHKNSLRVLTIDDVYDPKIIQLCEKFCIYNDITEKILISGLRFTAFEFEWQKLLTTSCTSYENQVTNGSEVVLDNVSIKRKTILTNYLIKNNYNVEKTITYFSNIF